MMAEVRTVVSPGGIDWEGQEETFGRYTYVFYLSGPGGC